MSWDNMNNNNNNNIYLYCANSTIQFSNAPNDLEQSDHGMK